MADPTFNVGGLASGLDTNSIIDKLVQLESRPLTNIQKQQTGYKAQVSALGDIASKLSALETAARDLGQSGALGVLATSENSAFSAAPGAGATPGTMSVQVTELASPAKWRSNGFAANATFAGGTLAFTVQGQSYSVAVGGGSNLTDVADAIRAAGAPLAVSILSSGGLSYLALTARDSGYPSGGPDTDALSVTVTPGTVGAALGLAELQRATNAAFTVDGLPFTSSSNLVTGAIPGVALTLQAKGGPAETLALDADAGATQTKLQRFVDAYNGVLALVQKNLDVTDRTDRGSTLAGDSTLRYLQARLQSVISTQVPGLSKVSTLADLGLRTARDGSLSIDTATLSAAIGRDPGAVNDLFSTAETGVGDLVGALVQSYVRPVDGLLSSRQAGLDATLRSLSDDQTRWEARIAAYKDGLLRQFTAMETVVSQLKNMGTFLNSQSSQTSK